MKKVDILHDEIYLKKDDIVQPDEAYQEKVYIF